MGNQYGPYVMYFLSKLMQQRNAEMMRRETCHEAVETNEYMSQNQKIHMPEELKNLFANDETESKWHKETRIELLRAFCPEGVESAERYGHFIIGQREKKRHTENDTTDMATAEEKAEIRMKAAKTCSGNCFIGIPGRFLKSEQPAGGSTGFTLWQPIKGGEDFFENLEELDSELAESIYGYWIAALDESTLQISEA